MVERWSEGVMVRAFMMALVGSLLVLLFCGLLNMRYDDGPGSSEQSAFVCEGETELDCKY
jgi:hypothetical protein